MGLTLCLPTVDLLGLLKWRSNTSLLQQNLRQLMKVDGGEVVKVRACLQGPASMSGSPAGKWYLWFPATPHGRNSGSRWPSHIAAYNHLVL